MMLGGHWWHEQQNATSVLLPHLAVGVLSYFGISLVSPPRHPPYVLRIFGTQAFTYLL